MPSPNRWGRVSNFLFSLTSPFVMGPTSSNALASPRSSSRPRRPEQWPYVPARPLRSPHTVMAPTGASGYRRQKWAPHSEWMAAAQSQASLTGTPCVGKEKCQAQEGIVQGPLYPQLACKELVPHNLRSPTWGSQEQAPGSTPAGRDVIKQACLVRAVFLWSLVWGRAYLHSRS